MSETCAAMSRSNYFHVKNMTAFKADCSYSNLKYKGGDENKMMVAPVKGDWPKENFAQEPIDVVQLLRKHLADGEVCILHTIAHDKFFYLNHAMVAFTSAGVILHDSQESFYDELNRLGYVFGRAEY